MYKNKFLITYHTLTPLHVGSGSSLSHIDLPIQRERHTSFPMMAASGIKGVFRNQAERVWNKDDVNSIFGPEDGNDYSSSIAFTDARVLFYPVKSVRGIFAWITCPFVLKRLKEDLNIPGLNYGNFNVPELNQDNKIIILDNSFLKLDGNKVGLEEFVFEVENGNNNIIDKIYNCLPETEIRSTLKNRFAIVSDNVFTDLVNYTTEVRTRIKIDQSTGVVSTGALFTLEMVPSEAIFYSLLFLSNPKVKASSSMQANNNAPNSEGSKTDNIESTQKNQNVVEDKIKKLFNENGKETVLQFGGDETIGLGFVKVKISLE